MLTRSLTPRKRRAPKFLRLEWRNQIAKIRNGLSTQAPASNYVFESAFEHLSSTHNSKRKHGLKAQFSFGQNGVI